MWDDAVRMSRGGTSYERVMKVQNAGDDTDLVDEVCRIHVGPLQFVQW